MNSMKKRDDCFFRSILKVFIFFIVLPVFVQAKPNLDEALDCISWAKSLSLLAEKKNVLRNDFYKYHVGLVIDDYNLYSVDFEKALEESKTVRADVKKCHRMKYPKVEDGLIPIEKAVLFVNSGGDVAKAVNDCVKALHVLVLAADRLKDDKLGKEALAMSPRLVAVVENLNPKLISAKDIRESLMNVDKFKDTKVTFGSSEYKRFRKQCDIF